MEKLRFCDGLLKVHSARISLRTVPASVVHSKTVFLMIISHNFWSSSDYSDEILSDSSRLLYIIINDFCVFKYLDYCSKSERISSVKSLLDQKLCEIITRNTVFECTTLAGTVRNDILAL